MMLCILCDKKFLKIFFFKKILESCIDKNLNYSIFVQESEAPQGLGGAMISAVKRGCVEAVTQLLLQGAPLNVKDSVSYRLFNLTMLRMYNWIFHG